MSVTLEVTLYKAQHIIPRLRSEFLSTQRSHLTKGTNLLAKTNRVQLSVLSLFRYYFLKQVITNKFNKYNILTKHSLVTLYL